MKKFFEKFSYIGCLLPFIIGGVFSIVIMFTDLWEFSDSNIGLFILNLILIPFAFIGGINVLRGVGAVLEMDEVKFRNKIKGGWGFYLYAIIHIGGYLALFYMIIKYI